VRTSTGHESKCLSTWRIVWELSNAWRLIWPTHCSQQVSHNVPDVQPLTRSVDVDDVHVVPKMDDMRTLFDRRTGSPQRKMKLCVSRIQLHPLLESRQQPNQLPVVDTDSSAHDLIWSDKVEHRSRSRWRGQIRNHWSISWRWRQGQTNNTTSSSHHTMAIALPHSKLHYPISRDGQCSSSCHQGH